MPWIDVIPYEKARGRLRKEYDAALRRAGRIWNVVSIMSRNPGTLAAAVDLYRKVMHGRSSLSRGRREMLAVVVSATNHCVY